MKVDYLKVFVQKNYLSDFLNYMYIFPYADTFCVLQNVIKIIFHVIILHYGGINEKEVISNKCFNL